MELKIPELSLVLLIGVSGSGKSSFARKYFKKTEILSSDTCRGLVSDDENSQAATNDAFDVLRFIAEKRLKNGLLTVIDATNVQKDARKGLIDLARKHHVLPVAIVLDLPEKVCEERNKLRADRDFGAHVIRKQKQQLHKSFRDFKFEGFRQMYVLKSEEQVASVTEIIREKLYNNKNHEICPLDIIGDVHGCADELQELLLKLGYTIKNVLNNEEQNTKPPLTPPKQEGDKTPLLPKEGLGVVTTQTINFGFEIIPPDNRKAVFVGDLTDRGTDSPKVLRMVMSMVNSGAAYCVCGNHDSKLEKYLNGKQVQLKHGLEETAKQLEKETDNFKNLVKNFLRGLLSHYMFDNGNLVVAHAGIREEMQGRGSAVVRAFCMYGETTGEIDEFGLPVRYNWAKEYRGKTKVVFGHTPVPNAEWLNRTIDIDTGCVFGGKLTALRYPEEQLVSIDAKKVYCEPSRPFIPVLDNEVNHQTNHHQLSSQQENDDLLHIEDVIGKRIIQTRLRNNVIINEENAIAALEVMSRFAVNPKWLIYLPPTMSPCATSELPEYLEHPFQALNYYKKHNIKSVVCEEKHMGSRAILVICKDEKAVLERFGIENEGIGICYTRTGRNFFNDAKIETEFISRINLALTNSGFWDKFDTNWVCLDAELMPWSAKAQNLIKEQYAAVGAAASCSLPQVENVLKQALERGITNNLPELEKSLKQSLEKFSHKNTAIAKYITAYQHYCWEVESIDDYKLAPFHILATEGQVHTDKNHVWHMENIAQICASDPKIMKITPYKVVNFDDVESYENAVNWWLELTKSGGEGMVVKPLDFLAYNKHELLQPAVKCRGSEYLRIIYGAEYDMTENINRLKNRGLSRKQSLAMREFVLGIEGLDRFVRKEALRRVHETVFGVLALESEEIDPRL